MAHAKEVAKTTSM